jgi:hypothetical protein
MGEFGIDLIIDELGKILSSSKILRLQQTYQGTMTRMSAKDAIDLVSDDPDVVRRL